MPTLELRSSDTPSPALFRCVCGRRLGEAPPEPNSRIPPSITAILRTNQPLFPITSDHRTIVARHAQETSDLITSLHSQIADLQTSLEALSGQKDALESHLERCQTVFNPLRRVPYDVLAYIFRLCVDSDLQDIVTQESKLDDEEDDNDFASSRWRYRGTLDTSKGPWVLGQVCRAWRASVQSLPLLWTSIHVESSAVFSRYHHDRLAELLARQLVLCDSQSLAVSYRQQRHAPAHGLKLLSLLCDKATQWSSARISIDSRSFEFLLPFKGMFRGLRELHFHLRLNHFQDDVDEDSLKDITQVFLDAPSLSRVVLYNDVESDVEDFDIRLPWNQLTHFGYREQVNRLRSRSTRSLGKMLHRILPLMENLESASWKCHQYDRDLAPSPRNYHGHPFLRSLELSVSGEHPWTFLDWLKLPSLRKLKLNIPLSEETATDSLVRLLERSECPIEELSLVIPSTFSERQASRLFGCMYTENIHSLSYGCRSDDCFSEVVLHCLRFGERRYLPRLRRLDLHGFSKWPGVVLLDTLMSRGTVESTLVEHEQAYRATLECVSIGKDKQCDVGTRRLVESQIQALGPAGALPEVFEVYGNRYKSSLSLQENDAMDAVS